MIALPGCEARARALAERLDAPVVVPEVRLFPDGEIYVRLDPDAPIAGRDAIVVGSQRPAGEKFLVVAFLAGTCRDLGARRVGLVAPYLAFLRQDARFHPGEGVTARYFAQLMSQVVDWLVTVDPHLHRLDDLAQVYSIPTTVARSAPAIAAWIAREIEQPVIVGPDAESAQWVDAVAAACGAPRLVLEKTRRGDRDVSVSDAGGFAWSGRTPVLVDDIISTGRTMIEATRALRAAGSAPPVCVGIHAVFADAVHDDLVGAGAARVVTCNTIAHGSNRIAIDDCLADATRRYL